MRQIEKKYVYQGCILVTLFIITLLAGFLKLPFLVLAVLALNLYLKLDRKKLRCPYCNNFNNLDNLLYARHHNYSCSKCGRRIVVKN